MLENYRATTSVQEIKDIIEKSNKGDETFLWLTVQRKRVKYNIANFEIDDDAVEFSFNIDSTAKNHLHARESYYIKLDYDSSAFKVFVVSITQNRVTCILPDKVLSIEKRKQKRLSCTNGESNKITLKVESEIMKNSFQDFDFKVLDFSKSGLAIILNHYQMKQFSKVSGKIVISAIDEFKLNSPLEIEVLYFKQMIFKKNGTSQKHFRIGIRYLKQLDTDLFLQMKSTFL